MLLISHNWQALTGNSWKQSIKSFRKGKIENGLEFKKKKNAVKKCYSTKQDIMLLAKAKFILSQWSNVKSPGACRCDLWSKGVETAPEKQAESPLSA